MLERIFEVLWEFYGIPKAALQMAFSFFISSVIIFLIISLVLYIIKALGIFKMAQRVGLNNGWLAFIPIAKNYIFGKVAEKYIRKDRRRPAKLGVILAVLNLLIFVCGIALFSALFGVIAFFIEAETVQAELELSLMLIISFTGFLFCVLAIAYTIVRFIALWRIYAIFNYENASMFTVLTYFFGFLEPILIFISRNKEPKYDYNTRIGFNLDDY